MNKKAVWWALGTTVGIGLGVLAYVKRKFIKDSAAEISLLVRAELEKLKNKKDALSEDYDVE